MAKFYLVAKHEYLKLVKKRSFIISTLGVPVLYAVIIVVSIMASVGKRGELPVGYVDYAGVLSKPLLTSSVEALETVTFQAFDTQEHALEKLRAKQLQAVYILPAHYAQTGKVELYYLSQRPSELARSDFEALIKAHLMSNQPVQVQARLQEGNNLIIRAADNSREFDSRNILTFIVPFVAAFLFIIAVMNAGGYMLAAVTEEKENRTIEILSTSLRPEELIGGKALGLMGVGLSQLLIWVLAGVFGLLVLAQYVVEIRDITFPWSILGVVGAFFLPAYALMAGMMTMIGGMVQDTKHGQQIAGIVNMLFTLPFFFITLIIAKPNHPIVIGLSLFPTTAFITMTMRWAITAVPVWQLVTSFFLLTLTAILSIWAAARIFRFGMLRYGQSLNLRQLLNRQSKTLR